jgi:diguanylate cyclase (GGDEF)-like protein
VQQKWESTNGLPNDSVEAVLQTRDGYLWVATERGLSRFNGSEFHNFTRLNTPALKESYVSALFEARDGTLWIGTALNGLLTYRAGRFERVALPVTGEQGKITAIREGAEGEMWIGTRSSGLVRLEQGRARVVGHSEGVSGVSVRSLLVDRTGAVWLGTEAGGLSRWDGRRFVQRILPEALPGRRVDALLEDGAGTLWLASGRSVCRLAPDGEARSLRLAAVARETIRSLYVDEQADREPDLWVGTETAGLELHQGGTTTYFNAETGFDIDTAQLLWRDREGSMWVATDGFGLVQLRVATFRTITARSAFRDYEIRSLAGSKDGSFWIGTGDGLSRYAHGEIRPYPLTGAITNRDFRTLVEDHAGALWIGTDGGGLLRVAPGSHTAERLPHLTNSVVMALAEDARSHLWAGTTQGLTEIWDGGSRTLTTRDGLPSDVILSLLADREGRLWIGTPQGLAALVNGRIRVFGTADGIPPDTTVALFQDREGEVWVGAVNGLFHWTGSSFERWTAEDGLFSNTVNDITEGRRGEIWIRSNGEIVRIGRGGLMQGHRPLQTTKYDREDGILKVVAGGGFPGSLALPDGTLWFGSHKGLMSVDSANLKMSSLAPPVVIEEVKVDGRALPEGVADGEQLGGRAPPGRGNLEFRFAALSFIEHDRLHFKYRLEGFDRDWIDAGHRSTANYTNIPPGTYTFQVIAANRDGVWNSTGASYPITLAAHYYQTWPFWLVCVVLFTWGLVLLTRHNVRVGERRLVARQRELEALVAERTSQLEEEKQHLLEAREDLRNQARRDGMTGLLNRSAILEELKSEIARCARSGRQLAVAMADIDHFKSINDNYGHLSGDEVVRQISARLQASVRAYDRVGRYGGEEFLVLLTDFELERDRGRLERIRLAVRERAVETGTHSFAITCSVGVALFAGTEALPVEALLAAADQALYQAKRNGRDRVVIHAEAADARVPASGKVSP